jgi:hypothetical protein
MLTFDPDKRISAADALQHPYFVKFRGLTLQIVTPPAAATHTHRLAGVSVGRRSLASVACRTQNAPAPQLSEDEFDWENDKSLSVQKLREILYEEIKCYHPEMSETSYAPTSGGQVWPPQTSYPAGCAGAEPKAGPQVRDQMAALARGDKPAAGAMSMPAEATRPLYETAERMAAEGQFQKSPGRVPMADEEAYRDAGLTSPDSIEQVGRPPGAGPPRPPSQPLQFPADAKLLGCRD